MILAYVSGVVSTPVHINTRALSYFGLMVSWSHGLMSHVYRKHREVLINASNPVPTQAITNGRLWQEESGTDGDLQMDGWGIDLMVHERTRCADANPQRLATLFS